MSRIAARAGTTGLRLFFQDRLREAADADRQLVRAFPAFARAARHPSVQRFCREGVSYSRNRLVRLDEAFAVASLQPAARRAPAMARLIADAEAALRAYPRGPLRDAALIAAIQPISHFGRASYGTLVLLAGALGESQAARVLKKSLREKDDATREMNGLLRTKLLPRLRRAGP